ncbi:MAG: hypothetical protein NTY99_02570, partial [DPANN group archaeon]|nr:hypothetical protein [DPANN group archaeon]
MRGKLESNLDNLVLRKDANLEDLRLGILDFFDTYLPGRNIHEKLIYQQDEQMITPQSKHYEPILSAIYLLRWRGLASALYEPIYLAFAPKYEFPTVSFELVSGDVIVTDDLKFQNEYKTAAIELYKELKDYTRTKSIKQRKKDADRLLKSDIERTLFDRLQVRGKPHIFMEKVERDEGPKATCV